MMPLSKALRKQHDREVNASMGSRWKVSSRSPGLARARPSKSPSRPISAERFALTITGIIDLICAMGKRKECDVLVLVPGSLRPSDAKSIGELRT